MIHKVPQMLTISITNALFFLALAFGVANILFPHTIFTILHLVFGTLVILNELKYTSTRSWLFAFLILLAILILVVKLLMGFTVALSLFPNFVIGAGLAHAVARGSIKQGTAYLFFYLLSCFFIYHMLVGADPNRILKSSQNAVSLYMLLSLMILIFLHRQGRIAAPLFPSFLCLVLSVWAIGRSGIISSFIIFLAMLFAQARALGTSRSRKSKIAIRGLIMIFVILSIFIMWDYLLTASNTHLSYLIAKGLHDQARQDMMSSYLHHITPFSFLFGAELGYMPVINEYSDNPHNYYILLHSSFGLVALIMFILVGFHLIGEIWGGNFVYVISVFACLFRIGTDSGIGIFSFIFLTLTIYGINVSWLKVTSRGKFTIGAQVSSVKA